MKNIFKRNQQDNSKGMQVHDILFSWKNLRIVITFDSYYSKYGEEHWDKKKRMEILEKDNSRKLVKYLFTIPFPISYTINNSKDIQFKAYPMVFWVLKNK